MKKTKTKSLLTFLACGLLLLTGCSKSSNKSASTSSIKKAASSLSSSNLVKKSSDENKLTLANFNKIKVVEKTGSTPAEVITLFGRNADSLSKATVKKLKATIYTWEGIKGGTNGSNIAVEFANGVAIAKQITGLKVNRAKKITQADYNSLTKNMTQAQVEQKLGKPNGYSVSNYGKTNAVLWLYTSDIKSDTSTSIYVTFQNGKLVAKNANF